MTPAGRSLLIWGGSTGLIAVVGLALLSWRGGIAGELQAQADKLYGRYQTLYHPKDSAGTDLKQAETELKKAMDAQSEQLEQAEAALVPPLPVNYTSTDLDDDESVVHIDHQLITNNAMSAGVVLRSKLPLERLDSDPRVRASQMAGLYLYRTVLLQCIGAKVLNINRIQLMAQKNGFDPTHTYQTFACEFEFDATFEAGQHVLDGLNDSAQKGIWVSNLRIAQVPGTDDRQSLRFTATLVTPVASETGASGHAGGSH
jgi:hypothetical protein